MIVWLLVLLLLSGCAANNPLVTAPTETVDKATRGYLSLSIGWLVPKKKASAVVIRPGIAVTNRHVVEGESTVRARTFTGQTFLIKETRLSEKYDLAVLLIPCDAGRGLQAGPRIHSGEQIYALGTALGWPFLVGTVRIETFPFLLKEPRLSGARLDQVSGYRVNDGFLYEGLTRKGFSGGPVLNRAGELVGINQGYAKEIRAEANLPHPNQRHGIAYHIDDVLAETDLLFQDASNCSE